MAAGYNFTLAGQRIRALRKSRKWSQDDLLEAISHYGCSRSRNTLSAMENGMAKSFSLDVLLAMGEIFQCRIGYLLGEQAELIPSDLLDAMESDPGYRDLLGKLLEACREDARFQNHHTDPGLTRLLVRLLDRVTQEKIRDEN